MTGLKFSGVIVPDTDDQATGGTLASRAHSTGRQTKYRAAKAVAGQGGIPGNASNLSGAGCRSRHLASWCSPEPRDLDAQGREAAPPPN